MEKRYLRSLIEKFQAGTISESERKQLDLWYDSFARTEGYTQALSEEEKAVMEASLLKKINVQIDVPPRSKAGWLLPADIEFNPVILHNLKVAAAFSFVILLVAYAYFFLYPPTITHATGFGQTAQIILPDNSTVILNGNSTLNYKRAWGSRGVREVTLEGEAFFEVKPAETRQKFLVHTSDGFSVEVLGTEFTVSNRPRKSRVVLNSGQIQLNIRDQQRKDKLIMSPGELVEFGDNPLHYTKRWVNPEVYSSWKDNKLILDRTSLKELLAMIEDTYGLMLQVAEEDQLNQIMSGKVPAENLDTLIKDISAIYKVTFKNY